MSKRRRHGGESVSMRDYVDTRFRATNKAVKLALATVKDSRSTWIAVLALAVAVAAAVFDIVRH
jgi:hypothetical protein